MEGQSGLSELSVISWMSAVQGCPLSGVPLYNFSHFIFVATVIVYMPECFVIYFARPRGAYFHSGMPIFAVKMGTRMPIFT